MEQAIDPKTRFTLLKTRRDWLKWLRIELGMYADTVKERRGHASLDGEPKYPVLAFSEVESWNDQEQRPHYLSLQDLNLLQSKLYDACVDGLGRREKVRS